MATPDGLCECGCGLPAPIATSSSKRFGHVKGQPMRFVRGHATRKPGPDWVEEDRGYGTPCWVWQRYIHPSGYGHTGKQFAHRKFYLERFGSVPPGLELDHLCRVRACVNPDHLQAVTRRENIVRGDGPRLLTRLTAQQRYEVMTSRESRNVLAARYGISPYYVTQLRAGGGQDRPGFGLRPGAVYLEDGACRELRRRRAAGETPSELAAAFGVSRSWVYNFLNGRRRRSLREEK